MARKCRRPSCTMPSLEPGVRCKTHERQHQRHIEARISASENGFCVRCMKLDATPGMKTCATCRARLREFPSSSSKDRLIRRLLRRLRLLTSDKDIIRRMKDTPRPN